MDKMGTLLTLIRGQPGTDVLSTARTPPAVWPHKLQFLKNSGRFFAEPLSLLAGGTALSLYSTASHKEMGSFRSAPILMK
jgi:hypothetical protein